MLDLLVKDSDLILICGDITHFGDDCAAADCIDPFRKRKTPVFAVSGNCDYPEVERFLARQDMDLEGKIRKSGFLSVTGLGASLPCPGLTPNERPETEFRQLCERIYDLRTDFASGFILVVHQPPHGTTCDRLVTGIHVGSHAVRDFIVRAAPVLCITGHIHEAAGIDRIGSTVVVNPGPFRAGRYALIDVRLNNGKPEITDVQMQSIQ